MPKSRSAPYLSRRRWTIDDARAALSALEASGLPVSVFATREGLDPQRLYGWRRRLGAVAPEAPPAFVELRAGQGAHVEVVLRSGRVLRVPESFDASALRRLLDVLDPEPSC
jgi:hypothetical protein